MRLDRPGWRGPSRNLADRGDRNPAASPRGQPRVGARLTPGRWPGVARAPRTRSSPGSFQAWPKRGRSADRPWHSAGSTCRHWSGRAGRFRGAGGGAGRRPRETTRRSWGAACCAPYSGFFLLADALGHEQRGPALGHAFGGDGDLTHVVPARQVEHDVGHHLLEDGAQAAGAGAPLDRLLRDRLEGVFLDREPHILELEQLLVLLGERVLGLDQDAHQRVLVERVERHRHGQPAHQLGDEPVAQQIVGLDVDEGVLLDLLRRSLRDLLLAEPDLPPAGARLDDLLQAVERSAADEQDVLRIDLDVLLLRVLAAALGRDARDRTFENLQERLLHALSRDVAGDAGVLGLAGDLVDLGDGEGDVQDARQRLRQQRLAHAGRADQQDVALVELHLVVPARMGVDALVVVVDGDGEGLLRLLLADHILVQHLFDFGRGGDLGDRFGDLALFVLRQDLVAEGDALVTNVYRRPGDELPDRVLGLSAERAAEVLVVGHGLLVWEGETAGASRHFFFPPSMSCKLAMTWSISPYSLASSADMKRSRSMSFSIWSAVFPVCLAYSSLSLPRRYRISRAWISMS